MPVQESEEEKPQQSQTLCECAGVGQRLRSNSRGKKQRQFAIAVFQRGSIQKNMMMPTAGEKMSANSKTRTDAPGAHTLITANSQHKIPHSVPPNSQQARGF